MTKAMRLLRTSAEDIFLEEYVLFYNQDKSRFDEEDYLVALPFDAKKGFSAEFLTYFAVFLKDTADQGLDDLMDFLSDETAIDFGLDWDAEAFEKGIAELVEGEFYPYPRYSGDVIVYMYSHSTKEV